MHSPAAREFVYDERQKEIPTGGKVLAPDFRDEPDAIGVLIQ